MFIEQNVLYVYNFTQQYIYAVKMSHLKFPTNFTLNRRVSGNSIFICTHEKELQLIQAVPPIKIR